MKNTLTILAISLLAAFGAFGQQVFTNVYLRTNVNEGPGEALITSFTKINTNFALVSTKLTDGTNNTLSVSNALWSAKVDATNGSLSVAFLNTTNHGTVVSNGVVSFANTRTGDATNGLKTAAFLNVTNHGTVVSNGVVSFADTRTGDATNSLKTAAFLNVTNHGTVVSNGVVSFADTRTGDATNGLKSAAFLNATNQGTVVSNGVVSYSDTQKLNATNGLWTATGTAKTDATNGLWSAVDARVVGATNATVLAAVSTTIGDRTIVSGYNLTPGFNSTTRYYALGGGPVGGQTTEGIVGIPFLKGTITNLYVRGWAVVAGTNVAFTLMTNGVATHITANFNGAGAGAQATANDTTHGLVLPANGTTMSMRIVGNNASASAASVSVGWAFELIR